MSERPAVVVTLYGGADTRVYLADGSGTELEQVRMIDLDEDDLAGMDDIDLTDWADNAAEWNLPEVAEAVKQEIAERLADARDTLERLLRDMSTLEVRDKEWHEARRAALERDIARARATVERLEGNPL